MQIAANTPNSFWRFMETISVAAALTERQREALTRAADRHRGQHLYVSARIRPADVQVGFAMRCLGAQMTRGETAAALVARFGIGRSAAYARIRQAIDNRRPPLGGNASPCAAESAIN